MLTIERTGCKTICEQGCRNTLPNLSSLDPFHSGQVKSYKIELSLDKYKERQYDSIYVKNSHVVRKKSVDPDQLTSCWSVFKCLQYR